MKQRRPPEPPPASEPDRVDRGLRVRLRAGESIVGELQDWSVPVVGTGDARTVSLPSPAGPGIYAYKIRGRRGHRLDPDNPRTRSRGGHRNNVLVSGGAAEPILFAPVDPWLVREPDGGVRVVALVRRGHGEALDALWQERAAPTPTRTAMERIDREDEHDVYAVRLPVSTRAWTLAFDVGGNPVGDRESKPFVVSMPRMDHPPWLEEAVIYTIFVDRFAPREGSDAWSMPNPPTARAGGHLDGVTRGLDALAALGITAILLTPTHVGASSHRYDVVDPKAIDPALGGEPAFARLVERAHALGMRVIVDFSFSHAGRGFPPYEDVRTNGQQSAYADWFQWSQSKPPRLVHYGRRRSAPLFNLHSKELQELVLETVRAWADRGVDGLRLDAAADVPIALARRVREAFRHKRPDGAVIGEVVPEHAWRFLTAHAVDAATDFSLHDTFVRRYARGATSAEAEIAAIAGARWRRGGAPAQHFKFLSTHDHVRMTTDARARDHLSLEPLGLLRLLTMPSPVGILYGEELGLSSPVAENRPEAVWLDRMILPRTPPPGSEARRQLVGRLLALRARHPAITRGVETPLVAEGDLLVVRKRHGEDVVDVVVNTDDRPIALGLDDTALPVMHVAAAVGDARISGSELALGPTSAVVLTREPDRSREAHRRARQLHTETLGRSDREFEAQATRSSGPQRVDFAVTEACNIRCKHCITNAPTLTREKTARQLEPWLIDRLRDVLGHAHHFAFVHGGESLATRHFFDLLAAIRTERAGRPTDVHVLTNGMLATPRTIERLVELGVTSISFSLDGTNARINDEIREGSSFETVTRHARHATTLAKAQGVELRVGISSVLSRASFRDAERFVDLAVDLGVDWLKLEELYPINAFARSSLVQLGDKAARLAIERASERAAKVGLVLVDHTRDVQVFKCALDRDPFVRAFSFADDFANRVEINPCRRAWEHACIEPDGTVKIGDFFSAPLGSVAFDPFDTIWNGTKAIVERERAPSLRLCGHGPITCTRATDREGSGAPR